MQKGRSKKKVRVGQTQGRPGIEGKMNPKPDSYHKLIKENKLKGKVAIVTGGDSGIGKAVAILFAQHGAKVVISFLNETKDAKETLSIINEFSEGISIRGDLSNERSCKKLIATTIKKFGVIDVVVNNAAIHYETDDFSALKTSQLKKTFSTNVYPYFWVVREAMKYMNKGACIINTSSVTAYRGSATLPDYAATKGAIVSFTRSLSAALVTKGIRVNGVAPGPIWTPLIASSFDAKKVAMFGSDSPMGRAGEPVEIAPSYLFLACEDSAYMTGQFLHPNGGEIVNG